MKKLYTHMAAAFLLPAILCISWGGCSGDSVEDPASVPCRTDSDCATGTMCSIPGGASIGECVADPCAACITVREVCIDSTCVPVYPYCNNHEDCRNGEYCEQVHKVCLPLATDADIDDMPGDALDPDNDDAMAENDNAEDEIQVDSCRADSDCQDGWICNGMRTCIKGCMLNPAMCDEEIGTCNPRNYHCECCDPMCNSGESCNFNASEWYCGTPCEPACPDGYACSGGSCVELKCANCPPGYTCSAETCYTCKRINATDGDVDAESSLRRTSCIPGMEPCRQGIDSCCSGVCFEGRCM